MPQFDFSQAGHQILWLTLVFGFIYLLVSRTLPRVRGVVESRAAKIASELSAAERARREAEAAHAGGSAEVGDARGLAQKLTGEARARAGAEIGARLKAAEAALAERIARAESDLAQARATALAELDKVAADAAAEMVRRVGGLDIAVEEAAQAVRKVAA
jgi:F-type H+-transporting ATPase subunit b